MAISDQQTQEAIIKLFQLIGESRLPSTLQDVGSTPPDKTHFLHIQKGQNDGQRIDIEKLRGFFGDYDPTTNIPALSDSTGVESTYYRISKEGDKDLGSGSLSFKIDDILQFKGGKWRVAGSITTLATTKKIDLGDIGSATIEAAFNTANVQDPATVQNTSKGLTVIKAIQDGKAKQWVFIGNSGVYDEFNEAVEQDFLLDIKDFLPNGGNTTDTGQSLRDAIDANETDITAQDIRIGEVEGLGLFANQSAQEIYIKNASGTTLSTLSVAFLNNEGTTFVYNETTKKLELQNDEGAVLSAIPVSAFVSNLAATLVLSSNKLSLKDSENNEISFVEFQISNINGLQAALDAKETPTGAQAKANAAETNAKNYADTLDSASNVEVVDNLTTEDAEKALSALQGKILKGIIDDAANFTNDDKLNVRDFGAIGSGITDDTQSIKDALLAAKNGSIKRVYLPAGNYMISNTLFIPSDVEIFGAGMNVTRIFLKENSSLSLPLIHLVNSPNIPEHRKWRTMICTEKANYSELGFTENINVSDLSVDWNDNPCGLINSIIPILFGKTKNSHVRRVDLQDALPSDMIGQEIMRSFAILFAISDDCSLTYSKVGSADYESVSIRYISKRTKIENNIITIDKPDGFSPQAHALQTASGVDGFPEALLQEYGEDTVWGAHVKDNVFLMKRNSKNVATSHTTNAFHFDNNIIKYYSTLGVCNGFKPFDATYQFSGDGNIFDLTEYTIDPFTIFLIGLGSYVEFRPVRNGSIINNKVFLKSHIGMPQSGLPAIPLIGGIYSAHSNVQILNNNVYVEGETSKDKFIFGATGVNIQVSNNNVFLQNQATEIDINDIAFFKTKGGAQISVSGNQVYGKIGKGVIVEDTEFGLSKLKIKDNQWDAIQEINKDSINDAEILLEEPKERESKIEVQLNNIVGNKYNYTNPLSETSYTYKHPVVGGKAFVLINTATEPVLLGASKKYASAFQSNTDMVMAIEVTSDNIVEYTFLQYDSEIDVWVTDINETTAVVNFKNGTQSSYEVYIDGVQHGTISSSGDQISGLNPSTIHKLKLKLTGQPEFSKEINFKTVEAGFLSTWNTQAVGVSANDEIQLPLIATGSYNFEVRYNGVVIKTINNHADNVVKFPDGSGIKQINCVGLINGWEFRNTGDRLKINRVDKFGSDFNVSGNNFMYGAENLSFISTDLPASNFTSGTFSFAKTGLTDFAAIQFSNVNSFAFFLFNSKSITSIGLIDFGNATDFKNIFNGASSLKSFPAIDFSNGKQFKGAFFGLGALTNFSPRRFYSMEDGYGMFTGTIIPTNDYSEILISIEANNLNDNVVVNFGDSKYNASAQSARAALVSRGWIIVDAGLEA